MKTAYYILRARNAALRGERLKLSGAPRTLWVQGQCSSTMSRRGGNVVDMETWRAVHQGRKLAPPLEACAPEEDWKGREMPSSLCRLAAWSSKLHAVGEAAATLSVLCVAAALLIRILVV